MGGVTGIEFMPEPEWNRSNRWLTVVLITPEEFGVDREQVRVALEEENIEARPVWKPMHMQPVFDVLGRKAEGSRLKAGQNKERYRARVVGGEVAEDLFERGLCLPSGTAMTNSDLDRVVETIMNCRKKAQKTQREKKQKNKLATDTHGLTQTISLKKAQKTQKGRWEGDFSRPG